MDREKINITQGQADLLVKFGYSYEEIRNWSFGQAGRTINNISEEQKRKRANRQKSSRGIGKYHAK